MSIYSFLNNKKDTMDPDPKKRNFHSRFYHRYFEDYVEYESLDERGKLVIVRHYKGSWYIEEGDRSQRIRTYYFNHDYVVDHRLGLTVPRAQNTMNGELDPFISALRLAEKTERLQSLHD